MPTKLQQRKGKDSYMALIRRLPLRPIRNEAELDRAIEMIDHLIDKDKLDSGEDDYLDVLSDLVHDYESKAYPSEPVPQAGMLEHLLEARGVTHSRAAKDTGIAASTFSAVLAGKRKLSPAHVTKLAAYFHVSPAVFMEE